MEAKLRMATRGAFGFSNRALLNVPLLEALRASTATCEACCDIAKDVDPVTDGGEFVEAASFPGQTVRKLDAHFKYHWKDAYERVERSG